MQKDKCDKNGNKNVVLFIAILVVFLILVGVICYGIFMTINTQKEGEPLTMVAEATENVNINSNGDPIVEYDETADWNSDVIYVASILNTSMVNADDVMHQVSALFEEHFATKLYFFNRFEKVDNTDAEYRIMTGDSLFALRVSIQIEDDSVSVTFIDEVDVLEWKNETKE